MEINLEKSIASLVKAKIWHAKYESMKNILKWKFTRKWYQNELISPWNANNETEAFKSNID